MVKVKTHLFGQILSTFSLKQKNGDVSEFRKKVYFDLYSTKSVGEVTEVTTDEVSVGNFVPGTF